MIKMILLCAFLLYLNNLSFSQNVTITGKAPAYEGEEISVLIYDDYLSYTEKELANSKIDDEGNFKLTFDIASTTYAKISINETVKTLYIEPGSKYEIIFPSGNAGNPQIPDKQSGKPIEIVNADDNELNRLISNFDSSFSDFTIEHYPLLIKGGGKAEVDSFIVITKAKYSNINNSYFNTHIHYNFASIEQLTLKNKKKLLEERYILSQPVMSNHKEYMDFITSYFTNHLLMLSLSQDGQGIRTEINENKNYQGLMNIMGNDNLLANGTLRELILLKGLYEVFYNPDFKQGNILDILDSIAVKSKIAEHQKIAKNIMTLLTKLIPGSKAPAFELFDLQNKLIKLSDFKGKYVYLDFWATWCAPCLKEMRVLQKLSDKYKGQIEFVSISVDRDFSTMKKFLEKNDYSWTFLHYGGYKKVKSDYNIKSIPAYFLIDAEGFFKQSPAEGPGGNIERVFIEITQPKSKKLRIGSKENR